MDRWRERDSLPFFFIGVRLNDQSYAFDAIRIELVFITNIIQI